MTDVAAQIQQLREQAQAFRDQRARAEQQRDVAQQAVDHLTAELQSEFGAGSVQEAEALLVSLNENLAQQAAAVSQHLAQAGAPQ